MIRIELESPIETTCECCHTTSTRLTRFVYNDDDAYAVYYASYGPAHPDEVKAVISVGEWSEGSTPQERTAFPLVLWKSEAGYAVTAVDAASSLWKDVEILGEMLNREEALRHPRISDVFHITDHIFTDDPDILSFFAAD